MPKIKIMSKYPMKIEEDNYEIESKFHHLVYNKFGKWATINLHKDMSLSAHQKSKAYLDPENRPIAVVLAFSMHLDLHPYVLISEYNLGKNVDAQSIAYFKKTYKQSRKTQQAAA